MPGADNAHKTFGRPDQVIKAFAKCKGDDTIVFAVNYQHRCGDLAGDQIRAKLVLHEKPHRHEPIMVRTNIDR